MPHFTKMQPLTVLPPHGPDLPAQVFTDGLEHLRNCGGKAGCVSQHPRHLELDRQPLLGLSPRGDVRLDSHEIGQPPGSVVDGLNLDSDPVTAAVLAVVENLRAEAFALAQPLAYKTDGFEIGPRTVEQLAGLLAQHLSQAVSRQTRETFVDPHRSALGVREHNRVVGARGDQRQLARFGGLGVELGGEFLGVRQGDFARLKNLAHVHRRIMGGEIFKTQAASSNFRRIGEPRGTKKQKRFLAGQSDEFAA